MWWSSPVASASSQVIISKQVRRVSLGVAIKIFGSDRWGSPRQARAKIIVEEQSYKRSKSFLQKHPRLQPNMRSVLLDWLIEVRLQLCPYFTLQILEYNRFSWNFQSSFHLHCSANYFFFHFLNKVSDIYTLHRQTFYLAQDYFDRFMLTQNDVEKGMLQLIGITCLFIASKVEVSEMRSHTCNTNNFDT